MKNQSLRFLSLLLSLCLVLCLWAFTVSCKKEISEDYGSFGRVDLDLSVISGTVVYAAVNQMVNAPDDYIGKIIKVNGEYTTAYSSATNLTYPSVLVADATACCQQGIEFVLKKNGRYPEKGANVTVIGRFETYTENGLPYFHLVEAELL